MSVRETQEHGNAEARRRKGAEEAGETSAALWLCDSALPDGFRDTSLGPLPEGWEVVRLGNLANVRYGKAKPKQEGSVPVVGSGGIYAWVPEALINFPTMTIGRKGTAGVTFLQERPFWPSDTTFYLEWKSDKADYRFVFHCLQNRPLSGEHAKTTLPSLQKPDVENYLLPLPSLFEQRAIAHTLRTVQQAREAAERIIAAARELKRSLMRHLFTYGPVPVSQADQVELQETEIGPIPAHWKIARLAKVTEKPQYGYTASATDEPVGPKFLRITDIQDGRVMWGTVPYCEVGEKDLDKYLLSPGDILIARIGATTGKTYLVTQCPESVFASYLIRVRVRPMLIASEYLHHFTGTQIYWVQINASKGGRLKQGVNIPVLQSLLLPLPSLPEQREIAHILSTVDAKIAAEEARRAALDALFHTLLHHLMTGRVRAPGMAAQGR